MDDGSKREIGGTNTWVWDPNETGEKSDSGIPWLNVEYYSNEVGSYTWSTSIYWRGWEFTGTG
ncbi:MAG TPA: hypothetical protein PKX05_00990, partial [bacterium]|nr:hypothetical protein [bacterium]